VNRRFEFVALAKPADQQAESVERKGGQIWLG
jgi:hypothetical protein